MIPMPKSRGRRLSNRRQRERAARSRSRALGHWEGPEPAALLPWLDVMQAVDARERAGDAAGALDLMEQHRTARDAAALAALGQKLVGPAAELCWRTARLLREPA